MIDMNNVEQVLFGQTLSLSFHYPFYHFSNLNKLSHYNNQQDKAPSLSILFPGRGGGCPELEFQFHDTCFGASTLGVPVIVKKKRVRCKKAEPPNKERSEEAIINVAETPRLRLLFE